MAGPRFFAEFEGPFSSSSFSSSPDGWHYMSDMRGLSLITDPYDVFKGGMDRDIFNTGSVDGPASKFKCGLADILIIPLICDVLASPLRSLTNYCDEVSKAAADRLGAGGSEELKGLSRVAPNIALVGAGVVGVGVGGIVYALELISNLSRRVVAGVMAFVVAATGLSLLARSVSKKIQKMKVQLAIAEMRGASGDRPTAATTEQNDAEQQQQRQTVEPATQDDVEQQQQPAVAAVASPVTPLRAAATTTSSNAGTPCLPSSTAAGSGSSPTRSPGR